MMMLQVEDENQVIKEFLEKKNILYPGIFYDENKKFKDYGISKGHYIVFFPRFTEPGSLFKKINFLIILFYLI